MIRDKYLEQLVNMDDGEIAELLNMDGALADYFQRLTTEHGKIREPLSQVIRDRESDWCMTFSHMVEFEKQCCSILKELEDAGQETVAKVRAELFIASLVETVAKVRAEWFITSQIDQCLYWVLVDDCGRCKRGDPGWNEEEYKRVWEQFKYIKHTEGCAGLGHVPPWWWLCEGPAGEDIQFLKDNKELICKVAREYWEDFLKNVVVEDKDEVVKKIRQSVFEDIEDERRRPPKKINKLIKEILKCARMLSYFPPPLKIPKEKLA